MTFLGETFHYLCYFKLDDTWVPTEVWETEPRHFRDLLTHIDKIHNYPHFHEDDRWVLRLTRIPKIWGAAKWEFHVDGVGIQLKKSY